MSARPPPPAEPPRRSAPPPTTAAQAPAGVEAVAAAPSPQKLSPSYRLAFEDDEFLRRSELRPVRLELEILKPELIQAEHGVRSTVVIFGSTRILEREKAEAKLALAEEKLRTRPGDPYLTRQAAIARRVLAKTRYYDEARRLAALVSSSCQVEGRCDYVIITGGGPGIMEAANRGAADVGAKSIGLNIVLPFEQEPNRYITPELCFQFHYFATRKMHFLIRAKALVCFPGGFGTIDELFETLTLIQTKKISPVPLLLFGKEFWSRALDFEFLIDEGTISPEDAQICRHVETAEEAWQAICEFYAAGDR